MEEAAIEETPDQTGKAANIIREMLLYMLTVVFTLPLASIINRFIPSFVISNVDIDLLLSVTITFFLMKWLIFKYRKVFIIVSMTIFVSQVVGYFVRGYTFYHVFNDYRMLVHNLWNQNHALQGTTMDMNAEMVAPEDLSLGDKIKSKVSTDSIVRNFAVEHSFDYFEEYERKFGGNVRFLSLFKYINTHFKYISDPKLGEYFAYPSETIKLKLRGDCDDHTILMVSCIKAIGGEARMVMVEGHIYPEIGMADEKQFQRMVRAIDKLFHDELKDYVHYHVDRGKFWINLDYSASYPGGPYLDRKVLNIIYP
jgi:hypothetical protein